MWPVFGYYRVREEPDGDAVAVADRTVPGDFKPTKREKDPISADYTRRDGSKGRLRRRNAASYYMPLRDCPTLFKEFARLADRGEIGRETWRRWLDAYGVLGVQHDRTRPYQRDVITDSYFEFVREALLANKTLRLFEAVTSPDGLDVETIRELLSEEFGRPVGDEPDQIERAALRAIEDTIEQKVHADCYERLVLRDTGVWREKRLSPFARRWEFTSLLGAMWLQYKWLVLMDDLRYCKAPGCGRHISPHDRTDRETCSDKCRKRLWRGKQKD